MRRREFITLLGGAAVAWPLPGRTQRAAIPVIGWLHSLSGDRSAPVIAAFSEELRRAGYVEGQNVAIEYRWADGKYERLAELAADLARRKVDVIVTGGGSPAALAAKTATSTIPIVFAIASDPVESGIVQSLARPDANVTGISNQSLELMAKRLQLMGELVPHASAIGLLVNPKLPITEAIKNEVRRAAAAMPVRIEIVDASSGREIETAFAELARSQVRGLVVGADAFFYDQRDEIARLAAHHALPAIYELSGFVLAGGLMSYAASLPGAYRQAAAYVVRVLAGTKPADLPVQQPTNFELTINLKTAKALGLTIPPTLLARANEVIE
jgi:putative tryptophan/tyrosine transport system substrate-binding protein